MRTIEMAKNEDQTSSDTHNQFKQSYSVWRTIMHFAGPTDSLFNLGQVNTVLDEYSKSVYGLIDIHHSEHSIEMKFHAALKYFLHHYEKLKRKRDQGLMPGDGRYWSILVHFPSFKELLISVFKGSTFPWLDFSANFYITPLLDTRIPMHLVLNTVLCEKNIFLTDFNKKMLSVRRIIKENKSRGSVLFNFLVNMICILLIVVSFAVYYDLFTSQRFLEDFALRDRNQLACDGLINIINSDATKLPALPQWFNASRILCWFKERLGEKNGKKSSFFIYAMLLSLPLVAIPCFISLYEQLNDSIKTFMNYFKLQNQRPKFELSENLVSFFETAEKRHLRKTESCVASNNSTIYPSESFYA